MSTHCTWIRRVVALVTGLGLAAALGACDSGGSSKSDAGTSTTTRRRSRHGTRTTTSTTASTNTTAGTPGTVGSTPSSTSAPAGTAACGPQVAMISAAVTGGDLPTVPVDSYTVGDCRLAASQPIWSAVTLTPKPGQSVSRLTVVVERIGSIWTVHSYGTGATGCDAPAPVPSELRLGC
jgi:hypothetical protein